MKIEEGRFRVECFWCRKECIVLRIPEVATCPGCGKEFRVIRRERVESEVRRDGQGFYVSKKGGAA